MKYVLILHRLFSTDSLLSLTLDLPVQTDFWSRLNAMLTEIPTGFHAHI
jgi:hypothetical protein